MLSGPETQRQAGLSLAVSENIFIVVIEAVSAAIKLN